MVQGIVQWTNHTKGYGFILCEDQSVFFHHSITEEFHILKDGSKVEVEIGSGEKGPKALSVKVIK
ncbi:MAG: cold shock domain-containing protein [Clostridiales bacterium]|nr:cold shock domain-containing protein [Clostridiales bacterium]